MCSASGALNYKTFDGAMMHYGGTCKYLLAGVANGQARNGLPAWRVLAHNQRLVGQGRLQRAYTKYVEVEVHGYTVTLDSDKRVLVSVLFVSSLSSSSPSCCQPGHRHLSS